MKISFFTVLLGSLLFSGVGCTSNTPEAASTDSSSAGASLATDQNGRLMVSIANLSFEPASLTVKAGSVVAWKNNDRAVHSIVFDDGSLDSGNIPLGAVYDHAFTKSGTYFYHCGLHSSMKGTVIVE